RRATRGRLRGLGGAARQAPGPAPLQFTQRPLRKGSARVGLLQRLVGAPGLPASAGPVLRRAMDPELQGLSTTAEAGQLQSPRRDAQAGDARRRRRALTSASA